MPPLPTDTICLLAYAAFYLFGVVSHKMGWLEALTSFLSAAKPPTLPLPALPLPAPVPILPVPANPAAPHSILPFDGAGLKLLSDLVAMAGNPAAIPADLAATLGDVKNLLAQIKAKQGA